MPLFDIKNAKSDLWNFIKVEHHFWHLNAIIWHLNTKFGILNAAFSVYEIDPGAKHKKDIANFFWLI